jgi:transposase, IS5 family
LRGRSAATRLGRAAASAGQTPPRRTRQGRRPPRDERFIEADIDHPTDADLPEHAVRTLSGLVGRIRERGAATRTRFPDRSRAAGRRLRQISRTLRRRTGQAPAEIDRLTAEVAAIVLWVPRIRAPHATWAYSWINPPR